MKKLVLLAVLIGLVSSSTGCIVPLYDGPGRGGWHHHHGGWSDRGDGGGWGGGRHHRHHDDD
jgi:hypothetical protein